MDNKTLSRRERRHYRKYKDGEIIYNSEPGSDYVSKSVSKKANSEKEITLENLDFKTNSKNTELNKENKTEIINKILTNLSNMIKPDVNLIAETIYEQLKNSNIDVEKNKIENAIKTNKHYRASEESSINNINENKEDLRNLVEDVYSQVESNDIREKIKKENDSKERKKELEKEIKLEDKEETNKNSERESKRNRKKEENKVDSKNKKTKKKEEPEVGKKEDDIKDLLKEDDDSEEEFDLDNSDDDLGLKF